VTNPFQSWPRAHRTQAPTPPRAPPALVEFQRHTHLSGGRRPPTLICGTELFSVANVVFGKQGNGHPFPRRLLDPRPSSTTRLALKLQTACTELSNDFRMASQFVSSENTVGGTLRGTQRDLLQRLANGIRIHPIRPGMTNPCSLNPATGNARLPANFIGYRHKNRKVRDPDNKPKYWRNELGNAFKRSPSSRNAS